MNPTAHAPHPQHLARERTGVGWRPVIPIRASFGLLRWRLERACRKRGGHWWHFYGGTAWHCCQCGKPTHGAHQNGTAS